MDLSVKNISVAYGRITVLKGVDIDVRSGEYVAVVGANGAGKTTLLRTISGILKVQDGDISVNGESIAGTRSHLIPRRGIAHVPEGRQVFPQLSVSQNLVLGAYTQKDKKLRNDSRAEVFDLFPRLKERSGQLAGTLSGGEQQMLALGRALMLRPGLLLLDEPSQGLAPKIVAEMYRALDEIHRSGMTILLVEQNVATALKHAQRAYVLEHGRVSMSGDADELAADDGIRRAYLGV